MFRVIYRTKSVYGEDKKYPVSPDAILIAAIAGTRTLTDSVLETLRQHQPNAVIRSVETDLVIRNNQAVCSEILRIRQRHNATKIHEASEEAAADFFT